MKKGLFPLIATLLLVCLLSSVHPADVQVQPPKAPAATVEAGQKKAVETKAPLVLELEHSVDGATFTARGKFTVTLNAEGKYTVSEAERNSLTAESIGGFKELLRTNDLYRIRFRSLESSKLYVTAALPACELQKSGFKEDISVFLGPNQNVVGLSYSSPVIALSRSCDHEKLAVPTLLLSRIKVSEGESSMAIPMQAQGPKPHALMALDLGPFMDDNLKMHGEAGPGGSQQNQSFLRKYWYIVVFLVIYLFMKDDGPAEPSTGKGKPAAAAAAVAAKSD